MNPNRGSVSCGYTLLPANTCGGIFGFRSLVPQSESAASKYKKAHLLFPRAPSLLYILLSLFSCIVVFFNSFAWKCFRLFVKQTMCSQLSAVTLVGGRGGAAAAASARHTHPSLTYLMAGFWWGPRPAAQIEKFSEAKWNVWRELPSGGKMGIVLF